MAMAMGRGLTVQIEDGSYSLNSWNSIRPGKIAQLIETRQPHGKKLGGHFQLAVNFQNQECPTRQLITPASLLSSSLQPAPKNLLKDWPKFDDAEEENTDSEDEEISDDDDDDDDGDFDQRRATYNYHDSIPTLTEGGDEESDDESDDDDSDDEDESKSNIDEVKVAIDCLEEMQRKELGFTLLDNSYKLGGINTKETRRGKKPLGSMSPSSDKENLNDDETVYQLQHSERGQKLRGTSSEQMGIGHRKHDLQSAGIGQSKQSLADTGNISTKYQSRPLNNKDNIGGSNRQETSLSRNRTNIDQSVTGTCQAKEATIVVPKASQRIPNSVPNKVVLGHRPPPEQEVVFCGKTSKQMTELSPKATPFVPVTQNHSAINTQILKSHHSHSWVGLDNKPTSWSAEYNIQEDHLCGVDQGNDVGGGTGASLVDPERGGQHSSISEVTSGSRHTDNHQQNQRQPFGFGGGALARPRFENAEQRLPAKSELHSSREGSPRLPDITMNKTYICNNSPQSEIPPVASLSGTNGRINPVGSPRKEMMTNARNHNNNLPSYPSSDYTTKTNLPSTPSIAGGSKNENSSHSYSGIKEQQTTKGRTEANKIFDQSERQSSSRKVASSQDGGGSSGMVSARNQPGGKLSDAQKANEYEWRKYKVVRKVKKVLKPAAVQSDESQLAGDVADSRLPEDIADQLLEVIIDNSSSFEVFDDQPKEVAIVLEQIVFQAVEDTVDTEDYQREFIILLHKLSSIIKNFHKELMSALKSCEFNFIQTFTASHTEKMGLQYCQFLGRLLSIFADQPSATRVMLEGLISSLTNKWIIFNEKGTNSNAENTELSFAKCLKTVMCEIRPCYSEEKWAKLIEAVRGQIFGKRSQTVKEVFLEILLHSEASPRKLPTPEPHIRTTVKTTERQDYARAENVTKEECSLQSNKNTSEKTEKDTIPSRKKGMIEDSLLTDVGKRGSNAPAPSLLSPQVKGTTNIQDRSTSYLHKRTENEKPKTERAKITGTNKDASANGEVCDWWDMETVARKQVWDALQEEIDLVEDVIDENITKQGNHIPKQGHCVPEQGHSVSKQGHYVPEQGQHVPEQGQRVPEQGQRVPEQIHHVPEQGQHVSKQDQHASEGSGGCELERQRNRGQQAREDDKCWRNVKEKAPTEVWDRELIPNPSPLTYSCTVKRRINDNSLRGQRERYERNIDQASRTYEVYSGIDGGSVSNQMMMITRTDHTAGGIVQADDDMVILEETSDSESKMEDEEEEDVPLIWGEIDSGHQAEQTISNTICSSDQSISRHDGPVDHHVQAGHQEGSANETFVVYQTPWHSKKLMVFQEEEDTESALSGVEVIARRSLEERKRFGRGRLWHPVHTTQEIEINSDS